MKVRSAKDICAPVRPLDIDGIPETARLVLLVGENGSGKSTLLNNIDRHSTETSALRHKWYLINTGKVSIIRRRFHECRT